MKNLFDEEFQINQRIHTGEKAYQAFRCGTAFNQMRQVLKDTYRRNATVSAVQLTRDSLHPKILSNMKYNKWANAHGFRNLTVTAKGSSQDSLWRKSVVVLYMWEKLPQNHRCNQPSDQPQVRATLPTVFEERIHSERNTEESSYVHSLLTHNFSP